MKSDPPDTEGTAKVTPHLKATTVKAIWKTLKMLPCENAALSLMLQLKSLEVDISNIIDDLNQEKSCWRKTSLTSNPCWKHCYGSMNCLGNLLLKIFIARC